MFKVKQNDIFSKNMSQGELYQVYKTFKENKVMDKILDKLKVQLDKKYKVTEKQEMDKFLNKLITKNGVTKY